MQRALVSLFYHRDNGSVANRHKFWLGIEHCCQSAESDYCGLYTSLAAFSSCDRLTHIYPLVADTDLPDSGKLKSLSLSRCPPPPRGQQVLWLFTPWFLPYPLPPTPIADPIHNKGVGSVTSLWLTAMVTTGPTLSAGSPLSTKPPWPSLTTSISHHLQESPAGNPPGDRTPDLTPLTFGSFQGCIRVYCRWQLLEPRELNAVAWRVTDRNICPWPLH